jgi:hypothetical protein
MAAVNIFRESAIAVLKKPKTIPLEGIFAGRRTKYFFLACQLNFFP